MASGALKRSGAEGGSHLSGDSDNSRHQPSEGDEAIAPDDPDLLDALHLLVAATRVFVYEAL